MKNRSNVIPKFLGSMSTFLTSRLHQEDRSFIDRMQTLKTSEEQVIARTISSISDAGIFLVVRLATKADLRPRC
ncbi:hypothetical protein PAHAL_5G280200 [Panicum hallii]|uniref:Uncharacterized protein n=1 Tax=Panicum hallii TaxID=206008 RepID=A0A2T8ILI3_9POAL|nr:hypothetical protein PAHAL_5G280200 [Panicum hallii]